MKVIINLDFSSDGGNCFYIINNVKHQAGCNPYIECYYSFEVSEDFILRICLYSAQYHSAEVWEKQYDTNIKYEEDSVLRLNLSDLLTNMVYHCEPDYDENYGTEKSTYKTWKSENYLSYDLLKK